MSAFTAIDLDKLPVPKIVEELEYATLLAEIINDYSTRYPNFSAYLESDPVIKLLEVAAYRELLLRQRINNAAKGVMLAYAQGTDLEHLAALYGVTRQIIDEGDPTAKPPIPPTYESDARLRHRTQLAMEGFTTAGSKGSYEFYGLSASGKVKDINIFSPVGAVVIVTVLSAVGDGTADEELKQIVFDALDEDIVRPLADRVTVNSANIVHYNVVADLFMYRGPDPLTVKDLAVSKLNEYVTTHHLLGHDITISGIHAALHQTGVQNVILHSPSSDITVDDKSAAFCTSININFAGIAE